MSDKKKYGPPKPGAGDGAHAVARAGLGAIPIAGTASIELLSAIVAPPLEKRRTKWMQEVGEALRQLEEKMGVVLESLNQNDQFVDTAIEATQIALKTSTQEKREALPIPLIPAA